MEWIEVSGFGNKKLGAIGFIGNDAVAVAAFFDDADGNQNGEVSMSELIASKFWSMEGSAITNVLMQARVDMDVITRDASVGRMAINQYLKFASSQIQQGVYLTYFQRGVGMVGKAAARKITSGMVKEFMVRKGFETAVKKAFMDI